MLHFKRNPGGVDHLNILETVVKHCFSQRRKILKNALAHFSAEFQEGFLEEGLRHVGASMHLAPKQLQWINT